MTDERIETPAERAYGEIMRATRAALEVPGLPAEDRATIMRLYRVCTLRSGARQLQSVSGESS